MTVAREHMERVLSHLSLALRKLAEEGVEQFVIAADHGYLYGEELAESEKIDPPGGKTTLIHRRVWAGLGAAASDSYLLTEVSRFGAASRTWKWPCRGIWRLSEPQGRPRISMGACRRRRFFCRLFW